MIRLISHDFDAEIARLHLANQAEADPKIAAMLAHMKAEIRAQGDTALRAYTAKFDRISDPHFQFRVSSDEIKAAYVKVTPEYLTALKKAKENIETFHRKQLPVSWAETRENGTTWGMQWRPISCVGLYVPGGRAPLPSTTVMNAVPAKIAGVSRICIATPPQPDGSVAAEILVAADLCGVDEIYKIGGAQAIFGLALGTESLPKVDKIVGPGNRYVTLAKQMVYGQVDIDKPAGPSEVLVYVQKPEYAAFAAADMLCQLEHDPSAVAVAISEDSHTLSLIVREIEAQLPHCSRREIIQRALVHSALLLSPSQSESLRLINRIASEHLVLMTDNAKELLPDIQNAGAIFLGPYSPVTLGDYIAGPNHVLPTSGTARFASPLSVHDFMKFSSVLGYSKTQLEKDVVALQQLTQAEGLDAHYRAVELRISK